MGAEAQSVLFAFIFPITMIILMYFFFNHLDVKGNWKDLKKDVDKIKNDLYDIKINRK